VTGPAPLLVRVDNRLIHGQVLEAWVPALRVQTLLVADDEASSDPFAQAAMGLALGEGLMLEVLTLAETASRLGPGGHGFAPATLLLLREVESAVALAKAGVPLPRLNLGNVHFRAGRKAVSPTVYLDDAELTALEALGRAGSEIEVRAVPSDQPLFLPALRARFAAQQ
jgi:PTS system mannose-specific IIB component